VLRWWCRAYIFTLDSLGHSHPKVIETLMAYLGKEAKARKNLGQVREAIGKKIQVKLAV
jgi:hypothetical protein